MLTGLEVRTEFIHDNRQGRIILDLTLETDGGLLHRGDRHVPFALVVHIEHREKPLKDGRLTLTVTPPHLEHREEVLRLENHVRECIRLSPCEERTRLLRTDDAGELIQYRSLILHELIVILDIVHDRRNVNRVVQRDTVVQDVRRDRLRHNSLRRLNPEDTTFIRRVDRTGRVIDHDVTEDPHVHFTDVATVFRDNDRPFTLCRRDMQPQVVQVGVGTLEDTVTRTGAELTELT